MSPLEGQKVSQMRFEAILLEVVRSVKEMKQGIRDNGQGVKLRAPEESQGRSGSPQSCKYISNKSKLNKGPHLSFSDTPQGFDEL